MLDEKFEACENYNKKVLYQNIPDLNNGGV
jgi:hypothetical protein